MELETIGVVALGALLAWAYIKLRRAFGFRPREKRFLDVETAIQKSEIDNAKLDIDDLIDRENKRSGLPKNNRTDH